MSGEFSYKLFRYSSEKESTAGMILAVGNPGDQLFRCFTLEDERRDIKVPGETRIPAGRYEIKLRQGSPKFSHYDERYAPWHKGMLWLQDVPGFTWIYIHPGSNDKDTAGCILVGDGAVSNLPRVGRGSLTGSFAAYQALYQEISTLFDLGKRVFLEVVDVA